MPDYHKRRKIINYLKYLKIIANSTKFFLKNQIRTTNQAALAGCGGGKELILF